MGERKVTLLKQGAYGSGQEGENPDGGVGAVPGQSHPGTGSETLPDRADGDVDANRTAQQALYRALWSEAAMLDPDEYLADPGLNCRSAFGE